MSLELYSKIEHLIDFHINIDELQNEYIKIIKNSSHKNIKSIIDIGCGGGEFMLSLQKRGFKCYGIDLSSSAVSICKDKGLNVECKDICSISGNFDIGVGMFDVLNYIKKEELRTFFSGVKNVLKKGGIFIADINTLYGFEEIAQGDLNIDKQREFLSIKSIFKNKILKTKLDYFKEGVNGLYSREEGFIKQYYHSIKEIEKLSCLKIKNISPLFIYSNTKADKKLITFINN